MQADNIRGASSAESASRWPGALVGALAAAVGIATAWGFTVDDALISARVAHHLAHGQGYRFNAAGPSVDCVTPLGWAFLLAPAAAASPWQAVTCASIVGGVLWVLAAAALGQACSKLCSGWHQISIALTLATSLPLAAWAVSGMETGMIMALGAGGAIGRGLWGAACAGVAAALRPELLPWAVTLAFGSALARRASLWHRALALGLAVVPAVAVAVVRNATFGNPAPLAIFAKPSDFEHGLRYGLGALLLSGPPYLLLAYGAWRRLDRGHWAIALAAGVHLVVLVGIGGDWMPFWRLAMPILPGVLVVGAALAEHSRGPTNAARLLAVLACASLLHVARGRETRAVRSERARLLADVAPLLAGSARVASVDVGWVGAASGQHVVDLAGVTDKEVAHLAGGHTSKRLPEDFLERRKVDALVLLLAADTPPGASPRFARQVEARVMQLRGSRQFVPVGRVELNAQQDYLVLRREQTPGITP
jgi:hypothetical protein